MTPNQVTATRVLAAFAAVALFTFFGEVLAADIAAVMLTVGRSLSTAWTDTSRGRAAWRHRSEHSWIF